MSTSSLVILISGSGSNLQAIIDAIENKHIDAEIKAVISNNKNAYGLQRAKQANIDTHIVDHKQFSDRTSFDKALIKYISPLKPDLILLAGFMRILSDDFIDHFQHRLINIHPSLLPKYKGLNTHQQVIENHDTVHGASVHYVNHELDSGQVVIQAKIPVLDTDNAETLASRVLQQEHIIYPLFIKMFSEGRLSFDNGQLKLDNNNLKKPLLWKNKQLNSQ